MLEARLDEAAIHPLSIEYLRQQEYPGSPLIVEKTLSAGSHYRQYLVSYYSEGLKLYAAMTVPNERKPANGWPVIIFNHGYIDPAIYSPTQRYTEYIDAIARNGYIVLRPDLRGHAASEGAALGAYGDPGYTIDALNALASIKQYADADPERIGMWGHSMGGYLVARAMVVSNDIKAGVIWAGVVAPYDQLIAYWDTTAQPASSTIAEGELPVPAVLVSAYGTPQENPGFWSSLSANTYASNLAGPVQLHHGTADTDVPIIFSDGYYADLIAAGQLAEYYVYPGDDHNIAAGFEVAMRRSLAFLDEHVKNLSPILTQLQTASPAQLVP
jgi:dipeptidyl aminopeptidase/acylaminoacyl peptidase